MKVFIVLVGCCSVTPVASQAPEGHICGANAYLMAGAQLLQKLNQNSHTGIRDTPGKDVDMPGEAGTFTNITSLERSVAKKRKMQSLPSRSVTVKLDAETHANEGADGGEDRNWVQDGHAKHYDMDDQDKSEHDTRETTAPWEVHLSQWQQYSMYVQGQGDILDNRSATNAATLNKVPSHVAITKHAVNQTLSDGGTPERKPTSARMAEMKKRHNVHSNGGTPKNKSATEIVSLKKLPTHGGTTYHAWNQTLVGGHPVRTVSARMEAMKKLHDIHSQGGTPKNKSATKGAALKNVPTHGGKRTHAGSKASLGGDPGRTPISARIAARKKRRKDQMRRIEADLEKVERYEEQYALDFLAFLRGLTQDELMQKALSMGINYKRVAKANEDKDDPRDALIRLILIRRAAEREVERLSRKQEWKHKRAEKQKEETLS